MLTKKQSNLLQLGNASEEILTDFLLQSWENVLLRAFVPVASVGCFRQDCAEFVESEADC